MLLKSFREIGGEVFNVFKKLYATTEIAKLDIGRGASGDVTTEMDKILEDIVLQQLESIGDLRVVSEEAGVVEYGNPKLTVIVDPLDGSLNAKYGIPFYSVSLVEAELNPTLGNLIVGYVKNLVTGDEYYAIRGQGAFKNQKKVATSKNKEIGILGLEFYPHSREIYDKTYRVMRKSYRVRCLGSISLDLCFIAEGVFDALVDFRSKLRVLDISAGKLIVEEAGGVISDDLGNSLDRIIIDNKTRTNLIVASNESLYTKILELAKFELESSS